MNIDFAFVLVVLTSLSGFIWLVDSLLFRQKRMDRSVQKSTEPPREPVMVEYARSLFPVLLIVLVFRSFLFEPFKIPSGSMIPTLLVPSLPFFSTFPCQPFRSRSAMARAAMAMALTPASGATPA